MLGHGRVFLTRIRTRKRDDGLVLIVGVALALLSLAVVIYPFVTSRRNSRHPQQGNGRQESQGSQAILEEIYASIETLMLEHQLGNIPQALYQEQLLGYRLDAAEVLRQRGEMSQAGSNDPDFLLEQEILAARSAMQEPGKPGPESLDSGPDSRPNR